ncbi:MAG: M20/M25/M40 family metallo-hydrolase [Gemmatimonadaceae bacterium]
MRIRCRTFVLAVAAVGVIPTRGGLHAQLPALDALRASQTAGAQAQSLFRTLTTQFGPRMMGTPGYFSSAQWAMRQVAGWGAKPAKMESFDSGERGWATTGYSAELVKPSSRRLLAQPLAYSSSTNGTVESRLLLVDSLAQLVTLGPQLKGRVVALGWTYAPPRGAPSSTPERLSDETLRRAEANPDPNDLLIGYHSRRATKDALSGFRERTQSQRSVLEQLLHWGVAAILVSSPGPMDVLRVDNNVWLEAFALRSDLKPPPTFVVSQPDFGLLVGLARDGPEPVLRLRASNAFYDDASFNVNVLADVRGSERPNEVVMLSAHLDAHPGASGAADNAAGVASVLEALRLILASGQRPRRTIRLALWGGEEQGGFRGSLAYARRHIGDLWSGAMVRGGDQVKAVLNLDNGAGRIRGVFAMGNPAAAATFRRVLAPFRNADGPGDGAVTLQNANQSDHEIFDALNIPSFPFIQDPLDYIPRVHHTQFDLPDVVPAENLEHNALELAWTALALANVEESIPPRPYHTITAQLDGRVEFRLTGLREARAVYLVSDFNHWNMFDTPLAKTQDGWVARLDLPPGRYLYKYIVDGDWTADPTTPAAELKKDGEGHAGLTERVVPPSSASKTP